MCEVCVHPEPTYSMQNSRNRVRMCGSIGTDKKMGECWSLREWSVMISGQGSGQVRAYVAFCRA